MVKRNKVYYCEQCKKWRGSDKQCPECKSETVERELPAARADCYFIPGIDKPLPRVTAILKVLDKPGLSFWKTRVVAEKALSDPSLSVQQAIGAIYQVRNQAGATGSDVHKIIERISTGKETDEQAISKIPQIQAYKKFCESVPHKILKSELTVYSEKMGFAGTLDAIIEISSSTIAQGEKQIQMAKKAGYEVIKKSGPLVLMRKLGKTWLVDYKSNNGVYSEFFLQLSAYKHALQEMQPKLKIDGLAIVHLKKDGTFEFIEGKDNFDVFLSALKIYRWLNEK